MPLISTRAAASAAGYGENLGVPNVPFNQYGTLIDCNYKQPRNIVVSEDGTAAYATAYSYYSTVSSNLNWYVLAYSRDITTGQLTYVSTTTILTNRPNTSTTGIAITPNNSFLYVTYSDNPTGSSTSNIIYGYVIDPTTKNITSVGSTISTGTAGASWPAISTDSAFLYVGTFNTNKIYIFSIDPTTGILATTAIYTTPASTLPYYPIISANNLNLYVSSYNGYILQYTRNTTTGNLTAFSPESVATGGNFGALSMPPNNAFVVGASATSGLIYYYGRDLGTGQLFLSATQGGSINKVEYSLDSTKVYGLSAGGTNEQLLTAPTTFQGTVDPSYGVITAYTNSNFISTCLTPTTIAASPNRDYFYGGVTEARTIASVYGPTAIIQYQIDGSGFLVPVYWPASGCFTNSQNSGVTSGEEAFSKIAISADGKSVYTNGYKPYLGTYTRKGAQFNRNTTTGVLTYATSGSEGTQQGYGGITISPDDSFLYIGDATSWTINQYSRNTTTGNLTALSPASVAVTSLTSNTAIGDLDITPDGTSLYAAATGTAGGVACIVQYSRNVTTGQLTAIGTINIGTSGALSYNPILSVLNNSLVYASNRFDTISVYSRNTSTGVLTLAFNYTLTNIRSFCISSTGTYLYALSGNGTVTMYSINSSTGALTVITSVSIVGTTSTTWSNLYSTIVIAPDNSAIYVIGAQVVGLEGTVFQSVLNPTTKRPSRKFKALKLLNTMAQIALTYEDVTTALQITPDGNNLYAIVGAYVVQMNA